MSTAISDAVLAVVSIACAVPLLLRGRRDATRTFAAACFLFIGLTAAAGAARYAGLDVTLYHRSMSWTSSRIAVPLLGATFLALALGRPVPRPLWYGVGLLFGGIGWVLPPDLGVLPGLAGMVAIAAGAWVVWPHDRRVSIAGATGVVLYLLAGLVIGTEGRLGGVPRVDLFHYALAAAHAAIAWGMGRMES